MKYLKLIKTRLRLPLVDFLLKNYNKGYTVTIRELDITANENYRPQLRRVKQSLDKNIVLCSSIEALPEILKQAQQVGLMTDDHQFIITTLDMHTIDLEPFQHSGTNITGFRIVQPDDPMVIEATEDLMKQYLAKNPRKEPVDDDERVDNLCATSKEDEPMLTADTLQVNAALTYDAVMLFSQVMVSI